MIFLKIAWRNLLRNRRRSGITLSAIAFGLASVVFLWSFVDGFQEQMVNSITSMITGDIQVYPKDAEGLYNMNIVIENPEEVRQIFRETPGVDFAIQRVIAGGIVSSANASVTTFVVGGEPENENKLSQKSYIVKGRNLEPGDEHGAVLGMPMSKELQVDVGDKVVVMVQDRYGQLVGESFHIVGFFETGSDQIDHTTVDILLPVAQRILSLDQRVTKFLVKVKPEFERKEVLATLRSKLDPNLYKASSWEVVVPMLSQLVDFQQRMIVIVVGVVLIVLAAGVLNTLMMSFVERIREFGLMKALGTADRSVRRILFLETLMITFSGSILGVILGLIPTYYFRAKGIDLSQFGSTFSNFLIGTTVYPHPRWEHILLSVCVVFITNMLASLYPTWRASKLQPIEAMRQVG